VVLVGRKHGEGRQTLGWRGRGEATAAYREVEHGGMVADSGELQMGAQRPRQRTTLEKRRTSCNRGRAHSVV
jgi:hypothetical protein